jgi:hypothetical protein
MTNVNNLIEDDENQEYTDEQKIEILQDFANKLINNQVDLDPEIEALVNEHFWELV